ncbi:MAG: HAMP domain-containing sensor histidine kinase [Zymomonas mobilis]|uniref:histidine kinase n=1 Tax=Zymomonas mobilis TaxID=542 RepID=A0A542VYZ3_ZYMMB|nr:HAMP domain-containing sensor histidine kinase [Zymomonas mobilis]TQL16545.1 histidine kinase [Zymomonas mobilis]
MTINTVSSQTDLDEQKTTAIIDSEDRLVKADELITDLHISNGGKPYGSLTLTALNRVVHLARRLQARISRRILFKNNDKNYDLWVDALPKEDGTVLIEITGWQSKIQEDTAKDTLKFKNQSVPNGPEQNTDGIHPSDFTEEEEMRGWKWQVDAELNLTSFPDALIELVGIDPDLYLKKPFARLFKLETNEDGHFPIMEALANHHNFCAQFAKITSDGPSVWLSGQPIFDTSKKFRGFEGGITLATKPQMQTVNLRSQDKVTLHLPDRIDHSFKPPLYRIIENAERISSRNDGYLHSNYVRYASDITAASQHLMMLVDDLADLQEMENAGFRIEAQPVDLSEIAKQAIALNSWKIQGQDIKIDTPKLGENVIAHADARRVMQILLNLISNALRYSPPKASIWIRVEQDQNKAYITIADQGKGIATEDQQRIFEKFERLNPQDGSGAGLGLFISRELARAMQGDIMVDSAPGQGARFTLMLPLL